MNASRLSITSWDKDVISTLWSVWIEGEGGGVE